MTALCRQKVVRNFSLAARSYDAYGIVQYHTAAALMQHAEPFLLQLKPATFLEIGAGTGMLTAMFLNLPHIASGIVSDISPAMIEVAREKFSAYRNITFRELDGEDFTLDQSVDMVISSAAFQWFSDLHKAFSLIHDHLNRNGLLVFSSFIDGTFSELKQITCALELPFPGHTYLRAQQITDALAENSFEIILSHQQQFISYYDDAAQFFRALKSIGSTNATKKPLSPGALKKIIAAYNTAFTSPQGVSATYNAFFAVCRRKTL